MVIDAEWRNRHKDQVPVVLIVVIIIIIRCSVRLIVVQHDRRIYSFT